MGETPAGTSDIFPKIIGAIVTGTSMSTVPETVGVRMRRNIEIRMEQTNWKRAVTIIKAASNPGPPARRASTLTAMAAAVVPVTRT